jgi:hypothetical protein
MLVAVTGWTQRFPGRPPGLPLDDGPAAERSRAGKVLASLAAVTAGAAVAGVGTFGTFTDSTTPIDTTVDDGVVSIDLSRENRLGTLPFAFAGMLPGGSMTQTVGLVNDGSSDLASVTLTSVATLSSVLDTDTASGLQMTVRSCSVPWSGASSCAGAQRTVLAPGPVIREAPLDRPASLSAGGADHLALTVSLPESAGNEFAGRSSALEFSFTAVQRPGAAR